MPAERIAENLAFINWTVLTGLAFGSFAAVVLARLRTDATRGFLSFTAGCAVLIGLLAYFSDQALPLATAGTPIPVDPAFDLPRRTALGLFCILAAAYVVVLVRGRRAPLLAGAGLAAATATLVCGALGWGGGVLESIPLLLQFLVLAIATGGVFAAMILGHWYLVTPKLPEAPLILISRILLAVVGLQVGLFAVWVATGAGPGGDGPFAVLVGPVGDVRLATPDRRAALPARRVLGRGPDGPQPVDGVGDRPPLHQRRHDRGRHDPRGRSLLRGRSARMTAEARG